MYYFSNLDLGYNNSVDDAPGKNITTFRGQVYVLHMKQKISGFLRIIVGKHSGSAFSYFRKMKEEEVIINTGNALFDQNFTVFTTNEQEAFRVLKPYVLNQLIDMKNRYGTFGIAIGN